MKSINIAHGDHGLSNAHVVFLKRSLQEEQGFFIKVMEMPDECTPLPCGLYGPSEGDDPIDEATDETHYEIRNGRPVASRILTGAFSRPGRFVVAIGVGNPETIDLFTAYGSRLGFAAPREPGDTSIETWEGVRNSRAFWKYHALAEHLELG